MLPPVYRTLRDSQAVVRLVGSRIYRHGSAPQEQARPYLTWFLVSGTPENTLSELPSKDRATIQIDCWCGASDGDRQVEELATAVRDALEPVCHMTSVPSDGREPATKLWRMTLQFDWFIDRSIPEPTS